MSEPTFCCLASSGSCDRCDLLVGSEGLRVTAVERDESAALTVTVESPPGPMGCPRCGVVAHGHGRVTVRLVTPRPGAARWASCGVSGAGGARSGLSHGVVRSGTAGRRTRARP
jgi:hypothetical protein